MTAPRPRTDAEIDAAVDRLVTPSDLPPMPTADVLATLILSISGELLDLWALRESIETHDHPEHALALLPTIAGHLDSAIERLTAVADELGISLPVEPSLLLDD